MKRFLASMATLVVLGGAYLMFKPATKKEPIKVWVQHAPTSADPMLFDFFVHHVTFGSVLLPLVSVYQIGGYQGTIADGWHASEDYKTWEFSIRKGMTFEDGTPITSEVVEQSFLRMGYLMKQKGSRSGMFEHLVGFDGITTPSSKIEGIESRSGKITLKFDAPVSRLLEVISFGLYGIAHPGDYNHETGAWLDAKKVRASGPYKIALWDDNRQVLELRKEFPSELIHKNPIQSIEIVWAESLRSQTDIMMAYDFEKEEFENHEFYGPAASGIAYVLCLTWYQKDSPCASKETRLHLRDGFYKSISKKYQPVFRSFLPLAMKDATESELPALSASRPIQAGKKDLKYLIKNSNLLNNRVNEAVQDAAKDQGYRIEKSAAPWPSIMTHLNYNLENPEYDFVVINTGIRLEDPIHDIRFMVNSKEGIRLPDPTGKLHELTKTENVDIKAVNNQIWEDAIVWPVTHFSGGLLVNKNKVDMSKINVIHPPTYFGWVGWE